jgi:hypothetical protein
VAEKEERQRRLEAKKKAAKKLEEAEAKARGLGQGLVVAEGQDFEFVGTGLVGAVSTTAGKNAAGSGAPGGHPVGRD